MKTRNLITTCGIAMLLTMTGCNTDFVEYRPLKLQTGVQNKLVPAPELINSKHLEGVKTVLDFYGEEWQMDDRGKLLIARKLARNKELLWNYTNKAEDRNFVDSARKKMGEGK